MWLPSEIRNNLGVDLKITFGGYLK